MAKDISEIVLAFKEFQNFLRNDADEILLQNIELLRTLILERIEKGKNINGSNFSKYSDNKVSASLFSGITKPAGARTFIERAKKNGDKISYKDIRDSVLKNSPSSKNFFFTGEMLNSVDKEVEETGNGRYELILEPRDSKNREKLIANENREGEEILAFSQGEIDQLVEDIEQDILDVLLRLLE